LSELSERTGAPCTRVSPAELPAASAVAVTAAHEVHGVVVALVGAGVSVSVSRVAVASIVAASTGTTPARQTALRALGAGQCCTATTLEVLAGGVAGGALCATISGARGAGFTLRHALETLLELIASLTQLLGELRAVSADVSAYGSACARVTGDALATRHQLLALRDDVGVVLAELTNCRCGTANIVGGRRCIGRGGRCGCATRDQK
jgi:hypothetical protein